MPNYRVFIKLHEIFEDENKQNLTVRLSNDWERVQQLMCYIYEKTLLGDPIVLVTEDGYMMPPKENISVIKKHDVLIGKIKDDFHGYWNRKIRAGYEWLDNE